MLAEATLAGVGATDVAETAGIACAGRAVEATMPGDLKLKAVERSGGKALK